MYVNNNNANQDITKEGELKLFSELSQKRPHTFNPIVKYVSGDGEFSQLSSDERDRILTLWAMNSTGQEYVILSNDPRWKKDYDAMVRFRNNITLKN